MCRPFAALISPRQPGHDESSTRKHHVPDALHVFSVVCRISGPHCLNLKGIAAEPRFIHLVRNGGEQKSDAFRQINPNATVPALVLAGGEAIVQSLAIMEYLDETQPEPPLLRAMRCIAPRFVRRRKSSPVMCTP